MPARHSTAPGPKSRLTRRAAQQAHPDWVSPLWHGFNGFRQAYGEMPRRARFIWGPGRHITGVEWTDNEMQRFYTVNTATAMAITNGGQGQHAVE